MTMEQQTEAPAHEGGGRGEMVKAPAPIAGALTRTEAMGAVGTALSAQAVAQVQLAMQFAMAHPRNEDDARSKMEKFTQRYTFAEKGVYSYPRGNTVVRGASVVLAKELMKVWRNMQSGHYTVADSENDRTVRCWAWDVEANARQELDVTFNKLIYRKGRGWIPADEREMLELTNKHGSKGVRNCILSLLPWDMVQDAVSNCRETVAKQIKKDPDEFRKKLVASFSDVGVSGAELTDYVGHPLEQLSKQHVTQLEELRGVYTRLREGEVTWSEVVGERWGKMGGEGAAPSTAKELRNRVREEAAGLAGDKKPAASDKPPPDQPDPPPQGRRAKE